MAFLTHETDAYKCSHCLTRYPLMRRVVIGYGEYRVRLVDALMQGLETPRCIGCGETWDVPKRGVAV